MRNASEQFVHWRHNSVALPQVLLNARTVTGAGEFDYPPVCFPLQIFCNRQPVTCDAILDLAAILACLAMLMKNQHRLDHASLQLAEIIDSCVSHRLDCITQERLGESVIDFAEKELFFQNSRFIDFHG